MKRLEELSEKRWAIWLWVGAAWLVLLLHLHLHWLGIGDKAVWLDEASTWRVASQPFWRVFTLPTEFHSQPPLYYLFLHFLLKLGSAEWFLRAPSWLCMGALLGFVLFAVDELGLLARLGFCALFVFSPIAHYLSQEIRPYAMGTLFLFIQQVLFLRLLRDPSRMRLYIVFSVLSLYTMSFNVWAFAVDGLVVAALVLAAAAKRGLRRAVVERRPLITGIVVSGILYIPYFLLVWKLQAHSGKAAHPTVAGALAEALQLDHFTKMLDSFIPVAAPWSEGVYGLVLAGVVVALWSRRAERALPFAVVLVHIACIHGFLFERSFMADRYFTMVWPLFLLAVALGLDTVARVVDRRAWLAVFAVLAWWSWRSREPFAAYLDAPRSMDGWRGVAQRLREVPGHKVVMYDVGYEGQILQYETRDDNDLEFRLAATTGWVFGGDNHMEPDYVRDTILATQANTRCYFYVYSKPDGPFPTVFMPEMQRLGYRQAQSPGNGMQAFCR